MPGKRLASGRDEHIQPIFGAEVVRANSAIVRTAVNKVAVAHVDPGVSDHIPLRTPEVEAIAFLEILEPGDRCADLRLLSRRSRQVQTDLAIEVLDES